MTLSNKIRASKPSQPSTPESQGCQGSVKPLKLEPMTHKIPAERNNLACLRLPVNYSGKWRDWNEPEIFALTDLTSNKRSL